MVILLSFVLSGILLAGSLFDLTGFLTEDPGENSVDIRVVHGREGLILRIRDDCVPFDPATRKDMLNPEDPCKNIGIRMVYRMAKDIRYQNILGLNVLTINCNPPGGLARQTNTLYDGKVLKNP